MEKLSFKEIFAELLKEMKSSGTDSALLLAAFDRQGDDLNPSTEETLEITKSHPNIRVVGSIDMVDFKAEDLAFLESLIKAGKLVGIKLYTGYQHFYPGDPVCRPVYELCEKYNIPVIFHSGDTLAGYTVAPKVKYSHPLQIDEVAADFPNLKIVIAHMGNPWLIDCAELLYKNPNVYADISGLIVPGQELDSDYGKLMKKRIQELIAYVGSARKLLYGTDWPLAPMKDYIKFVESLGIKGEDLDYVFYKNAQQLFKI